MTGVRGAAEFRKTTDPGPIIIRVRSGYYHYLAPIFDEYPIFEIRKAILDFLVEQREVFDWQADWVETRVVDLKKEEIETPGFWEKLLTWYVFNTSKELFGRAMDFAIGITKMEDFGGTNGIFCRSEILKIIAGRLAKSPEIYCEAETRSLTDFLKSFLSQACQQNYTITDSVMVDIRRVVRCAVKVEDWQFLTLIEQVYYKLYNQPRLKEYEFQKEVKLVEDIAFLKEALRLFREKAAEAKEDS